MQVVLRLFWVVGFVLWGIVLVAQKDSLLAKLTFEGDTRVRYESDFGSVKSDGSLRDVRHRFRYMFRFGATYQNGMHAIGFRVRTGSPIKQQDSNLTFGENLNEFGLLPMGFDKLFYQVKTKSLKLWFGKNTFPFENNNELFWSSNVLPEGASLIKKIPLKSSFWDYLSISSGHFVIDAPGNRFLKHAYFQGLQTSLVAKHKRIKVFPAIYMFRNIPNIPDGSHVHRLNYTILHMGIQTKPVKNIDFRIDVDFYHNIEQYNNNEHIVPNFKDQKSAGVVGLRYGNMKTKGAWMLKCTYAYIQKYAILDYMAQNDWARWDYSANNSPDGRLSNFHGIEFVFGYTISSTMKLQVKYFSVDQLIPLGKVKEANERFRVDFSVNLK